MNEFVCSKNAPYTPAIDSQYDRFIHPDAREVGEQENGWPSGDIIRMECPYCGKRWKEELPQ